ncbi:MAG: hypothetical protein AABX61_02200 [Nanoarchaeota archaeon]
METQQVETKKLNSLDDLYSIRPGEVITLKTTFQKEGKETTITKNVVYGRSFEDVRIFVNLDEKPPLHEQIINRFRGKIDDSGSWVLDNETYGIGYMVNPGNFHFDYYDSLVKKVLGM